MPERKIRTAAEEGPNLGKIVIFHQTASVQSPATDTPAIIQAVRETGAVRLFVFGHEGPLLVDDVVEGVKVGQYSWPLDGPAPPPALTALAPDTAVVGAPSFDLHVTGTGFTAQSVITFAGHDEPTTVVSDTEVTTGVDMAVWLAADAVEVTVKNADGQVSAPLPFTFTAAGAQAASAAASRKGAGDAPPDHEPDDHPGDRPSNGPTHAKKK
jgi:hypothetical protein